MPSPSASPIIGGMNAAEPARGSILVVDDEPTIAEVVARYLVRAGYETRTAVGRPVGRRRGGGPAPRPRRARHHAARHRRARGDAAAPRGRRRARARDPAHGQGRGGRPPRRAAAGRRRLRGEAVLAARAGRAGRRGAAAQRAAPDEREQMQFDGLEIDPARARVVVRGRECRADRTRVRPARIPRAPP